MTAEATRTAIQLIGEGWEIVQEPIQAEVTQVLDSLPTPPPAEVRALFEYSDGGYIQDVEIFTLLEMQQVNAERRYFADFPSAVFFAGDGGDGWFFIDAADDMGHGVGAIFWCDRASMTWGRCIPCSDSLPEFLLAVNGGETPWFDRADLIRQSTNDMLAALDAQQDSWLPNAPATIDDIYDASTRVGYMLPYPLKMLLQKSNGMIFSRSGVVIANAGEFIGLGGIPDTTEAPPLILFAQQQHVQYAVTTHTWQSLKGVEPVGEGFVVGFVAGQLITQAKVLGWLAYVIEEWLDPQLIEGADNGTK